MSAASDLYQALILDHNAHPRNFGALADATHSAHGYNPLCGDDIRVYATVHNGVVAELRFDGTGCAISKASASLMTQAAKGKSVAEVEQLFGLFHKVVTTGDDDASRLGKLAVFAGVREFPMRVKCATLSWHTLRGALQGAAEVSTESSWQR